MQFNDVFGQNLCVSKAGLTGLSGAASTFSTGATVVYSIWGKAYSRAAFAGAATPTVDFNTNAAIILQPGFGMALVWCLDAAGNARLVAGPQVALDSAGNFISNTMFGNVPDATLTPFAYALLQNAPTGTAFTVGVSLWNQTGITIQTDDVLVLPPRPQQT